MPQMMPINWMISFFFFIIIFIIFNIMNYYIFLYKNNIKNNFSSTPIKNQIWKW
nr:ATP synthase F0 subunit 8 [Monochroa sp.]